MDGTKGTMVCNAGAHKTFLFRRPCIHTWSPIVCLFQQPGLKYSLYIMDSKVLRVLSALLDWFLGRSERGPNFCPDLTIQEGFKCTKGHVEHLNSMICRSQVLYMSSSFLLLGVESCEFSHAEKERTACKAEQIHKMTTIFTQNDSLGPF